MRIRAAMAIRNLMLYKSGNISPPLSSLTFKCWGPAMSRLTGKMADLDVWPRDWSDIRPVVEEIMWGRGKRSSSS